MNDLVQPQIWQAAWRETDSRIQPGVAPRVFDGVWALIAPRHSDVYLQVWALVRNRVRDQIRDEGQ